MAAANDHKLSFINKPHQKKEHAKSSKQLRAVGEKYMYNVGHSKNK